ncbi:MAG: phosphatidylglycerophosphatase A [Candidatus Omnitrophota bacterium]|nr:phosphatidylglycerophosphatase A [Candidatus Omnitrophota bacterium]
MTSWASGRRELLQPPNILCYLRILLSLSLPFLILSNSLTAHIWAAIIFTVAAVTDYFDGYLARKLSLESDFGRIMDPIADKVLILTTLAAFSLRGLYSGYWLVPIFARELIVTFCRIGWLIDKKAVGAEMLGKVKLTFQVVVLAFAIAYVVALDLGLSELITESLRWTMFGTLIITLILTLVSGYSVFAANREILQSPSFAKFTSAMGVGLLPIAPGTWGSLFVIPLILLTAHSVWLYILTGAAIAWAGYWAVSRLDLSQNKDPSFVTVDEGAGMFVTFLLIPLSPLSLLTGFLLFRLFDIWKPFPARRAERLPGYWGILCDDLVAGFYAWLIMWWVFA